MLEVSVSSPTFGHPHEDLVPLMLARILASEGASKSHQYLADCSISQEQKVWLFIILSKEAQAWNDTDHCASSVLLFCVPAGLRGFDLREVC